MPFTKSDGSAIMNVALGCFMDESKWLNYDPERLIELINEQFENYTNPIRLAVRDAIVTYIKAVSGPDGCPELGDIRRMT